MNKARRKSLEEIAEKLEALRDKLEELKDEEQEYYDNMPEGIQYSERGERAEEPFQALKKRSTVSTARLIVLTRQ